MTEPEAASTKLKGEGPMWDVVIAYRRDELAWYQRRLHSTNTQAAGTITFGGVAATALAAVGRHLPTVSIILISLGGASMIIAAIRAFSVMDTSHEPALWFKTIWNRRPFRKCIYAPVRNLLDNRKQLGADTSFEPTADVRQRIAASLKTRLEAARHVTRFQERNVRVAGIFSVFGIISIIAGAAVAFA